jgi:hypothetical protein
VDAKKECKENFINKGFPVVYTRENIVNSKIVISKKDFKKFELTTPDSLIRAQECFNN